MSNRKSPEARKTDSKRTHAARKATLNRKAARAAKYRSR